MSIPRVGWRSIPSQLKHRQKEIMGEIKNGQMKDCVYNALIAGEISKDPVIANVKELVPDFVKPYQIDDLSISLGHGMVFNINKPGYGKTLETILWAKINLQRDFKILVLCPKTVIGTWQAQLTKYWPTWAKDGMWWITNYQQLYNPERRAIAESFQWDLIILDESHKIKSFKSQITEIVFGLESNSRHCLTGTPIKNRPQDLAAQLKWLDPFSISTFTDFQNLFCEMKRDAWGVKPIGLTKDETLRENLRQLLELYCVGGEEHDIGVGAPEVIKVRLSMDDKVKKLYRMIEGEYDKELKQRVIDTEGLMKLGIKVSSSIEAATRRQQLASNPQLFDSQLKNVKFEWILDWLEGTDEKVLILSKYAETIDKLEELFKKEKVSYARVKREQSSALRRHNVEVWKHTKQALIGTFGVLSEGVDGLQEYCHYLIFIDREWTASANEQAEKRIVRTGQEGKAVIYILQCKGTIDIKIEYVQLKKGQDASALLEHVEDEEE